jgi:aryl-phospho-beta-D-glucosidase BglC (GH1 family)
MVQGQSLVDQRGERITLRGYNVGGWMNMENFLTGYPATESLHREALLRALGYERYSLFFDRFLDAFFGESDVKLMASLGFNSVRIPFNYRHFESDDRPFELKDSGFKLLDRAIADCAKHGLYVILDYHALPGHQNGDWHSDNRTHIAQFWTHRHFQDRVVHLWEALADRYKDAEWLAGYNIMNEPADPTGEVVKPFYDRAVAAIRAIDPRHIIFLDGNRYSRDFHMFENDDVYENVVYSAHDYKTPGYFDGGPYPGVTKGEYVDRAVIEREFLERSEFMRATGTPIWIGEFGPVFTGDPRRDEMRYALLQDQLDIYREHGAGWSIWGYKDLGPEGLVSAAQDSPWVRRIQPVIEKKARLGVDHWGSTDDGIRHVMGPIEALFDQEYPDFAPFPFGRERWVGRLVRDILLAEPMVEDFGKCFEGIHDDETVIALAESFRLANCTRREPLIQLLSEAARAPDG